MGISQKDFDLGDVSGVSFWQLTFWQLSLMSITLGVLGEQRFDIWLCSETASTLQGLTAPEGGGLLRPREELSPSRAMRNR